MKILIVGDQVEGYIAQTHAAFQTGLKAMFDTRFYGKGHPGYDPLLRTFPEIIRHVFPSEQPDVLVAYCSHAQKLEDLSFEYGDIEHVRCKVITPVSDYWNMTDHYFAELPQWMSQRNVATVASLYPQLPALYADHPGWELFQTVYPTFDPASFNDWGLEKLYDVGFIGSGVDVYDPFYPERFAIHRTLSGQSRFTYLNKSHPGWGYYDAGHPQVGRGFSRHINACRFFVATGGRLNLALARYFETMASGTVLLAVEPEGAEELHLRDGVNYVKITPEDILDKLAFYSVRPRQCALIREAAYQTAMQHHSCYARALDFYRVVKNSSSTSLRLG